MGPGEAGTQPLNLAITELPSPNHDERPCPVDMLILHYTGMRTAREAVDRLRDPVARVSSHYVVDEDGTVLRLVTEGRRAWHAGVSFWRERRGLNDCSVGIEIVNPGHEWGYRPFPVVQMASVMALCLEICSRHAIPPIHVVGHSDVAPDRKQDPGELFGWRVLAQAGVGLWPDVPSEGKAGLGTIETARHALSAIGYDVTPEGAQDPALTAVTRAFQRHWCPESITGELDEATTRRLRTVAACFGQAAEVAAEHHNGA